MALLAAPNLPKLACDGIDVILAERAGPVVELHFDAHQEELHAQLMAWRPAAQSGLEAQVEFTPGDSMPLYLLGFRGDDSSVLTVAVALALPAATRDWFDQRPAGADAFAWLVAQQPHDGDAWEFLSATVGGRIALPPGVLPWNALFRPGTCILRRGTWDNRCFLEHLVGLIGQRASAIWGWSVINDPAKPLRLLTNVNPVVLDAEWRPHVRSWRKPNLLAGSIWSRSPTFVESSFALHSGHSGESSISELVPLLVQCGNQADTRRYSEAVGGTRLDQLVLLPGAVEFCGGLYYAASIRYSWRQDISTEVVQTLALREPMERAGPDSGALLLEGAFEAWGYSGSPAAGGTDALIKPLAADDAGPRWAVLSNEGIVQSEGTMAVRVLTPFAGRETDETAGLYVARRPGDEFVVIAISGQAPVAIGQAHRYDSAAEQAGIIMLHDKNVVLGGDVTLKKSLIVSADAKIAGTLDVG